MARALSYDLVHPIASGLQAIIVESYCIKVRFYLFDQCSEQSPLERQYSRVFLLKKTKNRETVLGKDNSCLSLTVETNVKP